MAESWARKLYLSKAWTDLRINLIQERGPICQRCGRIMADTSMLIGHHKQKLTPENINNPMITLNSNNVDLICTDCHNKEHQRFGHSEHKVYIVYGSPCSGKSAMVNQMKERGDLIVDMDRIFLAISGCVLYDKPDNLKRNAFRVRDTLLDNIRTRYGQWNDAYIIGGYPHKQERLDLASRLGAEIIYCEATKVECLARAELLGIFTAEWKRYVQKWWKECDDSPPGTQ